jgi:hypothetical protein
VGCLQLRLKRHRWLPRILKNRDPLVLSAGWRRWQALPLYATQDNNGRYRSARTPPDRARQGARRAGWAWGGGRAPQCAWAWRMRCLPAAQGSEQPAGLGARTLEWQSAAGWQRSLRGSWYLLPRPCALPLRTHCTARLSPTVPPTCPLLCGLPYTSTAGWSSTPEGTCTAWPPHRTACLSPPVPQDAQVHARAHALPRDRVGTPHAPQHGRAGGPAPSGLRRRMAHCRHGGGAGAGRWSEGGQEAEAGRDALQGEREGLLGSARGVGRAGGMLFKARRAQFHPPAGLVGPPAAPCATRLSPSVPALPPNTHTHTHAVRGSTGRHVQLAAGGRDPILACLPAVRRSTGTPRLWAACSTRSWRRRGSRAPPCAPCRASEAPSRKRCARGATR